jgi:ketosteroid isomerase-like protein
MSQENVEIARRGFEAYNSGDFGALRELYDPGVVWHHLEGWPEPGPSVGRDAVLREVEQLREAWQAGDMLELVGDVVDAGDRVLVRAVWRGSGSGPDAAMEFTYLFTLRKGRIITIQMYWDHEEALKAAGLRE